MKKKVVREFNVGDVFKVPYNKEFEDDFFIVLSTRDFMGGQLLDGMCEGAEDIQITINAKDVERVVI